MQQLLAGRTRLPGFSDEWEKKRFGDICAFLSTASNPRTDLEVRGDVGYIHYGNVHAHPRPVLDCNYHELPRIDDHRIGNASRLQDGDFVMVDASEDLTGLGKSVEVLGIGSDKIVAGLHTILCRGRSDHWAPGFKSYLQYVPAFRSALTRMATGISVYAISRKQLADVVLALPSPSEQVAIVAVLSDVDKLIESLEALIAKKRAVKTAAMQQLLTGITRLPGFSDEWETKCVGDVASVRDQKVLPSCVEANTLCVELDHIGQGSGRLTVHSTAESSTSSKYCFATGDVLFGRLRPYLRKFWHADRSGICTTEIWPLVVDPKQCNGGFLHLMVQTERFMEAASISYGTHMPRADWEVVRNLEISLPSLGEQGAIVAVFADIDAEIVALEHRLAKVRAVKQGMMQQLLTGRIRLPTADAPARDQVESVEEDPVGALPMREGEP